MKFKKKYRNSLSSNGDINYSGKIIAGSRILGNWWVHGKKRLFGNFFMWNKDYEVSHMLKDRSRAKIIPSLSLAHTSVNGRAEHHA